VGEIRHPIPGKPEHPQGPLGFFRLLRIHVLLLLFLCVWGNTSGTHRSGWLLLDKKSKAADGNNPFLRLQKSAQPADAPLQD
jgi:hypothetical protein